MRVDTGTRPGGFALRPLLIVVAAKCALNLAFAGRYGWQRDELYYAVAGQHLQGGYVEFPPLTALLSALARVLFGWSLVGFRALAILAGAATIVVAALVAREVGGGRRAQTLAAVAVGFSPLLLATNGRQRGFLRDGPAAHVPLTRAEVARELGMHESTVSRAVNGKHLQLPDGWLVPMAELFGTARSAQELLRAVVAAEARPLSDDQLADRLSAGGHTVARRTVAKYRARLGIPPAALR
jgi:hypothetical protein